MNERDESLVEDFLDGELSGESLKSFEKRLGADLPLRHLLDEIRDLRASIGALPTEAAVSERIWDGVLARIKDTPQERPLDVIPLPSAGGGDRFGRRLSFSVPQLAAAALVLVSLGSALTWSVSTGSQMPPNAGVPSGVVPAGSGAVAATASPIDALFAEYEASAAALMDVVENGASALTEETLQVVMESLAAIDTAVSEAREALREDPGSEMLNRILISNMQKKLDLLRNTAAAVQAIA